MSDGKTVTRILQQLVSDLVKRELSSDRIDGVLRRFLELKETQAESSEDSPRLSLKKQHTSGSPASAQFAQHSGVRSREESFTEDRLNGILCRFAELKERAGKPDQSQGSDSHMDLSNTIVEVASKLRERGFSQDRANRILARFSQLKDWHTSSPESTEMSGPTSCYVVDTAVSPAETYSPIPIQLASQESSGLFFPVSRSSCVDNNIALYPVRPLPAHRDLETRSRSDLASDSPSCNAGSAYVVDTAVSPAETYSPIPIQLASQESSGLFFPVSRSSCVDNNIALYPVRPLPAHRDLETRSPSDIALETPSCIAESAPAANLGPIRCDGGDSVKDHVNRDGQMVDRCLAGDERAWERLYGECHPRLRKAIGLLLRADAGGVHTVEEIAARVWYALLRDDFRLLKAYDADRDSTLYSFLMGLARIEILRYTRSERRRRSYEMLGGRTRLEEQRVSEGQVASLIDEFASTLTPGQREFMDLFVTGRAENKPDSGLMGLSETSIRARRHRIRRKLNNFLENL